MTGEEIQRNLVNFARKWSLYEGSERAEAQTFLKVGYPLPSTWGRSVTACSQMRRSRGSTTRAAFTS